MSDREHLISQIMEEYLRDKNKKLNADKLGKFMETHNLPRSEISYLDDLQYEKLERLLEVSKDSMDILNNWISGRTLIGYDDFEKLIETLKDVTGKEIDPKEISSEYMTADDIIPKMVNVADLTDYYLSILKHDIIKELFFSLHYTEICKLILYLDILEKFDMKLFEFTCAILCMDDNGQNEVYEKFPKKVEFLSFFQDIETTYDLIVLREKINNNQIEKDMRDYLYDFMNRNDDLIQILTVEDKSKIKENTNLIFEAFWNDFTRKIDFTYDGSCTHEIEYLLFYFKIKLFLSLFTKKENEDIWEWIICYFRVDDKDGLLQKVRKLYNENANYRTTAE